MLFIWPLSFLKTMKVKGHCWTKEMSNKNKESHSLGNTWEYMRKDFSSEDLRQLIIRKLKSESQKKGGKPQHFRAERKRGSKGIEREREKRVKKQPPLHFPGHPSCSHPHSLSLLLFSSLFVWLSRQCCSLTRGGGEIERERDGEKEKEREGPWEKDSERSGAGQD